jgi:AcrR family transcriptional regulator
MADVKRQPTARQAKAALTRTRMLDAARELFCAEGYRATTMEAIADRAGVAVQTVYFTFHTKDALLQEVHDRTVLGDGALPPPLQPWYRAATAEPDVAQAVTTIVEGVAEILARVAPMLPVFHAVSADPAGAVFRRAEELRRDGYDKLITTLETKAPLRPGLSHRHASDLLFVLLGPELYRTLVIERGWSEHEWAQWTATTIIRDLFQIVS